MAHRREVRGVAVVNKEWGQRVHQQGRRGAHDSNLATWNCSLPAAAAHCKPTATCPSSPEQHGPLAAAELVEAVHLALSGLRREVGHSVALQHRAKQRCGTRSRGNGGGGGAAAAAAAAAATACSWQARVASAGAPCRRPCRLSVAEQAGNTACSEPGSCPNAHEAQHGCRCVCSPMAGH